MIRISHLHLLSFLVCSACCNFGAVKGAAVVLLKLEKPPSKKNEDFSFQKKKIERNDGGGNRLFSSDSQLINPEPTDIEEDEGILEDDGESKIQTSQNETEFLAGILDRMNVPEPDSNVYDDDDEEKREAAPIQNPFAQNEKSSEQNSNMKTTEVPSTDVVFPDLKDIEATQLIPVLQGIVAFNFPGRNKLIKIWKNNLSKQSPNTYLIGATAVVVIGKAISSEPVRRCCYFWRRAGPIVVEYKFTSWWLKVTKAERSKRDKVYKKLHDKYAEPAYDLILNLKGLYVKIGQILSSRPDFVPKQYVEYFAELQDSVPQWSLQQVEDVIRRSFKQECGFEYDEVFESMDPVALGSASIGQVHRGVIRDEWAEVNGHKGEKEVAVKVMHPGACQRFAHDFQVFRWLCRIALPGWKQFLDELERQVLTEFDYRNEAVSLRHVRRNMARSPYSSKVRVPEPYEELCCKEVLVMEMLHGKRLVDAIEDKLALAFGGTQKASEYLSLKRLEVVTGIDHGSAAIINSTTLYGKMKLLSILRQCRDSVDLLVNVHGHQIFVDGCFNGDPHFGNCLELDDGKIGLIDYGQTRRIHSTERRSLAKIVTAINEGSSRKIAEAMRSAGFSLKYHDDEIMVKYARLFFDSDEESAKQGYPIPQQFFASLMSANPLVEIPDAAVFVARVSLLFRGFGNAIGTGQIKTSQRWSKHASRAVAESAER